MGTPPWALAVLVLLGTMASTHALEAYVYKTPMAVISFLHKTWNFVDEYSTVPLPFANKRERELLNRINLINDQIAEMGRRLEGSGKHSVEVFLDSIKEQMDVETNLHKLVDFITRINAVFSRMEYYTRLINETEVSPLTLKDFAQTTVSHSPDSVWSLMYRIVAILVPDENLTLKTNTFLEILTNKNVQDAMRCKAVESPQQVIFNWYNTIVLTELKAYTMIQFSYMLLKTYNLGNFTEEALIMKNEYEIRSNYTRHAMQVVLERASRELRRCDPREQKDDVTFLEITNFMQGYIENEADLNQDSNCWETCPDYKLTKSYSCYKDLYCRKQRKCTGDVLNCGYVDSDFWVCPAKDGDAKGFGNRRYEWIVYENGVTHGTKTDDTEHCATTKVDSWWRWLFWHCSYCMCICDEQGPSSDRYINLRAVKSDIDHNMVVTGLRFIKKNRIIHLQIQQGVLLARGRIDQETVQWKEVEDYTITTKQYFNNQDYITLTHLNRGVDLDDVHAIPGFLITGVRFIMLGSRLNLQIFITPFNFTTGQLIEPHGKSHWMDAIERNMKDRKQIRLAKVDTPRRQTISSELASKPSNNIEFTHTDFGKDAAQTAVPFIDAQDVAPAVALPLSGAGIYFKSQLGYGGYIAPRIFNADLVEWMKNENDV